MLDKLLEKEKLRYEKLKAPTSMEDKLAKALGLDENKTKNYRLVKIASFFIIGILVIGLNSNTIADYVRSFSREEEIFKDYDRLITGNLVDQGGKDHIQVVDRSLNFKNGNRLNIEGILVDPAGLRIFLKIEGEGDYGINLVKSNNKLATSGSGSGYELEDGSIQWIYFLEGPIKSEDIRLGVTDYKDGETKYLDIGIDRSKRIYEKDYIRIGKTVKNQGHKYRINSMEISPLHIVVQGSSESILELFFRSLLGTKKENIGLGLKLNGKEIVWETSNHTSDMTGSYFKFIFSDFPQIDLEKDRLEVLILDEDTGEVFDKINITKN